MASKTKSKAKKKADRWFSRYTRKSEADYRGYVRCITCKEPKHWKKVDAGHFISRSYLNLRFDERNVWPQCKRCNMQAGEPAAYAIFLEEKFGEGIVEQLEKEKNDYNQMTKQDYEDIATKYRNKFKRLS